MNKTNEKTKELASNFEIKAIPTDKKNIPQCPSAEAGLIPKHPFRTYIIGASGSGKTNYLLNLLTRAEFYRFYFDYTAVISPTANELDDSYAVLGLPAENYFEPNIEVLNVIREIQEKKIKEVGIERAPKVLLILDDIISYKQFCNSKQLLRYLVMSRHYNISMMVLSQCYHRIPKSLRLNMSNIVFFRGSQKECQVIYEDFCAPSLSKREMMEKINYATAERYNFLYIDLNVSIEHGRYRKNLTEQII